MAGKKLDPQDQAFLDELTETSGMDFDPIENLDGYSRGYVVEGQRIVGLNLIYMGDLASIPESIGYLTALRDLKISSMWSLRTLPESIGRLIQLRNFFISSCGNFQTFPESFGQLESLENFTMLYIHSLQSFPSSFGDLKNLRKFKIDNCQINRLPENFSELSSLEEVEIGARITEMPGNLDRLTHLRKMHLSDFQISTLPPSFGGMSSLETLYLDGFSLLMELPESIGSLLSLKSLELRSFSGIKSLPNSLGKLTALENLHLTYFNSLNSLPESLGSLQNLKTLTLENCLSLKTLPESIGELGSLETLVLNSANSLENLPSSLGSLPKLNSIEIRDCKKFKELSDSVSILECLHKLILIRCEAFSKLPDNFGDLKSLQELQIERCSTLKSLPESLHKLPHLQKVELVQCKNLVVAPTKFKSLPALESLKISQCVLSEQGEDLRSSKKIKTLEISNNDYSPPFEEKQTLIPRRWSKKVEPWRKIVLWGWSANRDPSFLVLHGCHKFTGFSFYLSDNDVARYKDQSGNMSDISPGSYRALESNVRYEAYHFISGKQGHFPSSQNVRIIQDSRYDYQTRQYTYSEPEMYHKSGLTYRWGWRADSKKKIKSYQNLAPDNAPFLPFFQELSYGEVLKIVKESIGVIDGFKFAESPGEVLNLTPELQDYEALLVQLLTNSRIYSRKRALNAILEQNPPRSLIEKILTFGSSEIISGLFLELARRKNPVLRDKAQVIVDQGLSWVEEKFARGIIRCARLYINALNPNLVEKRANWIRDNLPGVDLHLKNVWGKPIPPDKLLNGAQYRRYSNSGALREYRYKYDYETKEYKNVRAKKNLYAPSVFTDGITLNYITFKNVLQEADIYGLADIIGSIAYYLDAPRLYYYFKGSGHWGAYKYYFRYVRRILKNYAEYDEEQYIIAMKAFLSKFNPEDYLCKFSGNFSFNPLLTYFFYHKSRTPMRFTASFSNITGRFDYKPEIWDHHLDAVVEIALLAKIEPIHRACFAIFHDSPEASSFFNKMSPYDLVNLASHVYTPLSELFTSYLQEQLDIPGFNPDLMLALMQATSPSLIEAVNNYFNEHQGVFTPEKLCELLLSPELERWEYLFVQGLDRLSVSQIKVFLEDCVNLLPRFIKETPEVSSNITDALSLKLQDLSSLDSKERLQLFGLFSDVFFNEGNLPDWLAGIIEDAIFTSDFAELKAIVRDLEFKTLLRVQSSRNNRVLAILKALKFGQIPSDADLLDILEGGSSNMFRIMLEFLEGCGTQLQTRPSTLLILLETPNVGFNDIAKSTITNLTNTEKDKVLSILIDSPVEPACVFGLHQLEAVYGDKIPQEFLLQLLEHPSRLVKEYVSTKVWAVIEDLGGNDQDLFLYYLKTLVYFPNLLSRSKDRLYTVVPSFATQYSQRIPEVEEILLKVGGSNIQIDAERALVALAKIKREVEY